MTCVQDEAYELGRQWAKYYEPDSPTRQLILELMDTYMLVNVVHNDFKKPDAIFAPFMKAGADFAATHAQAASQEGHIPLITRHAGLNGKAGMYPN